MLPPFVRLRTTRWGMGGTTFDAYLAALLDLPDLASSNVVGIDGNADMLLGIANGKIRLGSYVAVEPDLVTAAFFSSHVSDLPGVELLLTDFVDKAEETSTHLLPHAPFDVAVVRTPAARMTADHLEVLLPSLRALVTAEAKVVLNLALARTTVSGTGAGDRLHDRGLLDGFDDYLEYEWELGTIPIYSVDRAAAIVATHGWSVDEVCEPRRGFQQHHLVLSTA